jgi:hypothetical protein
MNENNGLTKTAFKKNYKNHRNKIIIETQKNFSFEKNVFYEVFYVDHATRTIEEKGDEDGGQYHESPVIIKQPCKFLRYLIDEYKILHSIFELEVTTRGKEKVTQELDVLSFAIIDVNEFIKKE